MLPYPFRSYLLFLTSFGIHDIYLRAAADYGLVAAAEDVAIHYGVTLQRDGGIAERLTLVAAAEDVALVGNVRFSRADFAVAVDGEGDSAGDVAEVGEGGRCIESFCFLIFCVFSTLCPCPSLWLYDAEVAEEARLLGIDRISGPSVRINLQRVIRGLIATAIRTALDDAVGQCRFHCAVYLALTAGTVEVVLYDAMAQSIGDAARSGQ